MAKCNLVYIVEDLSSSMDERDPIYRKPKREVATEHIVKGICKVLEDPSNWKSVAHRADKVMVSIGAYGTSGSSAPDLILEPVSLFELKQIQERHGCNKIKDMILNNLKKLSGNGTSAVQLVETLKKTLEKTEKKCNTDGKRDISVTILIFGDGCFNIFRGTGDVYKNSKKTGNEIQQIVNTKGKLRGIIFLLYGDPSKIEDDLGICPRRAALISGPSSQLNPILLKTLEELRMKGYMKLEPRIATLSVTNNDTVKDYPVGRIEDPSRLALAVATITSSVAIN